MQNQNVVSRRAVNLIMVGIIAVAFQGCLVPYFVVVTPPDRVDTPASGKALVILLHASKFADPPANLFLDDRYIGTLRTNTHLAITLDPGSYRFMAVAMVLT